MNEFPERCKGMCPICACHLSCVVVDLTAALTHVLRRGVGTRWGRADLGRSPPARVGLLSRLPGPHIAPLPFPWFWNLPLLLLLLQTPVWGEGCGQERARGPAGLLRDKDVWAFPFLEAPALF